jgi:hypothetical protein
MNMVLFDCLSGDCPVFINSSQRAILSKPFLQNSCSKILLRRNTKEMGPEMALLENENNNNLLRLSKFSSVFLLKASM